MKPSLTATEHPETEENRDQHVRVLIPDVSGSILRFPLEQDRQVVVSAYLRMDPSALLIVHAEYASTPHGGEVEWQQLTLVTARGGRATRLEFFSPDQIDEATSRFDELTTPSPD